uniref:Uncharacterized protein n=1 Tax=Pithovirus LCPAC201 TaxID=2506591 RepID=A0A481Z717_9VIRU|nr:MAG: hypothetical protein LCPAC201_01810 [Pithovirus LCPAC201]
MAKLNKHHIFNFCYPTPSEPEELEELVDLIINPSDLLPDFREFRVLTLSVSIPSDFHRMVKEVLFVLPIIKTTAKYSGKIYGGLLREMVWISFQPLTFTLKVKRLVDYITHNQTNIWISDRFYSSELSPVDRTESFRTVHCQKSNTYHQIIICQTFSNIVDVTVNSLVLSLSPTHNYKLSVRGTETDLSITLDDIRKRRLHIITSDIQDKFNLSQVMIRAGVLFQNGWKPLNVEDQELTCRLFRNSCSVLIMRSQHNPILKENKTKHSSSYLIYTLLLAYYPDLTEAIDSTNHDQIKACHLLAIMNNDQFNLVNLLKISNWSDIRFALYITAEVGSARIFDLLYRKLELTKKLKSTQKSLVIALFHNNSEVTNYINSRRIYLPKNCQILLPRVKICWHQSRKNTPCNFKEIEPIVRQIRLNYHDGLKISGTIN